MGSRAPAPGKGSAGAPGTWPGTRRPRAGRSTLYRPPCTPPPTRLPCTANPSTLYRPPLPPVPPPTPPTLYRHPFLPFLPFPAPLPWPPRPPIHPRTHVNTCTLHVHAIHPLP